MLKNNYIKHTLNKTSFSEQCYYTFNDQMLFIPSSENSNDELIDQNNEINYGFGKNNPTNPQQFLPHADQTVNYGAFEACPSQDNGKFNLFYFLKKNDYLTRLL